MNPRQSKQEKKRWNLIQRIDVLILASIFVFSGCSIWDANLHPDYQSTRADQLCHPYGNCSQGKWIAGEGVIINSREASQQCDDMIRERYGNDWWEDSMARGLEIGRCMEKKGFTLEQ